MIKVKDRGDLFRMLMRYRESWVDDIYLGYIYLNCTTEQLDDFIRRFRIFKN